MNAFIGRFHASHPGTYCWQGAVLKQVVDILRTHLTRASRRREVAKDMVRVVTEEVVPTP